MREFISAERVFESVDTHLSPWVYFLIQSVLIWPAILLIEAIPIFLAVCGLNTIGLLGHFGTGGTVLFFAMIGALLAVGAAKLWPSLLSSGPWIWTGAVLFFLLGAGSALVFCSGQPCPDRHVAMQAYLNDYFKTGGSEGFGLVLLTYPSYSMAAYSLTMLAINRRRKRIENGAY